MADKSRVESRAEPRFNTDTAATIETIRGQVRTWDGRIANVSATGFRLMLDAPLELGETIRLTACGNQVFAEVRYCVNAGGSFVVGLERVDQWAAAGGGAPAEPAGGPAARPPLDRLRAAALRELFTDPRLRLQHHKSKAPLLLAGAVAVVASLVILLRWY